MKSPFLLKFVDFLASGCYSGYAPFASGTFGTIVAAILILALNLIFKIELSTTQMILLVIFTFILGIICCKIALKNNIYPSNEDPSQIVIDEFAGFFTTMAFIKINLVSIIIGFLCFRFFDILKPPPVKQADEIDGAIGIMLDDILAGIYAGILTLAIVSYFFPTIAKAESPHIKNLSEEFNINFLQVTSGKLAFSYEKGSDADIYYINFSKQEISPLATGAKKQIRPTWSPNGQELAYVENDGEENQIVVTNLSSGSKNYFGANLGLNYPSWSPDGKKIVSSSANSIYVLDLNNSKIEKLISPKNGKKYSTPVWSPRGDEIIYMTSEYWPGLDLELFNLNTKKPFSLTTGYQDFFLPSWHPSGGSFLALYGLKEDVDIWEFKKGESSPEILFQREGQELDAIWSEDGELLFFAGETPAGSNKFQAFVWIKSQGKIHQISKAKGSVRNLSWNPITE